MNPVSSICYAPAGRDPRWMTSLAWAFLCGLLLTGSGCNISPQETQTDPRVHAEHDVAASFDQTRLQMRAMVQPMSGIIVAAADQILAGTTDRAIWREALLWKIEAVPALREALFQPNPMKAVGDTWVLTCQMTDYFEKGPGAKALGEARGIAVTASQRLEAEIARVAASLTASGDVSHAREYARKWAAAHPITRSIAGRESLLSDVTARGLGESFSATEAVGSLVVTADDLSRRLEIYSAQLPDQARWQAELFAMDMASEYQLEKAAKTVGQAIDGVSRIMPVVERFLSALEKIMPPAENAIKSAGRAADALDRTLPAVERSLAVAEKAPSLIAAEREATINALSAELTRAITTFQEERLAILKQLTAERIAVGQDLGETMVQQRQLLAQDIDGIAMKAVDRAFLRAAQLGAASLVAVFFGIIGLMIVAKRVFIGSRGSGS